MFVNRDRNSEEERLRARSKVVLF